MKLNMLLLVIALVDMAASVAIEATPYCGVKYTEDPWELPYQYCNQAATNEENCEHSVITGIFGCRWDTGACHAETEDGTYICGAVNDATTCETTNYFGTQSCEWYDYSAPTSSPSAAPTVSIAPTLSVAPSTSTGPSSSISPSVSLMPSQLPTMETTAPRVRAVTTAQPTGQPTPNPTPAPTLAPTPHPSDAPSISLSLMPTFGPSLLPTVMHSDIPSTIPSMTPSVSPSESPSLVPSTSFPSETPTVLPSGAPASRPTSVPTILRSGSPATSPTDYPTFDSFSIYPTREAEEDEEDFDAGSASSWGVLAMGSVGTCVAYFCCCRRCCRKREEVADVGNVDDAAKMADKQKEQHDRREQQPSWDEEMG